MEHDSKPLLKHPEVAKYLNMSPNGLHDLCKKGEGPPRIVISKQIIRYDPDKFKDWLAEREDK